MRISLIHGEDTLQAYNRYRELVDSSRAKGFQIIPITDLKDIVSQSLFEDKTVFTLEKPKKIKPNDWKWFSKNASKYNSNLLIYHEGNALVTITKNLPKDAKTEKFQLPKTIFAFLDNFWPGNSKKCLFLFNELIKVEPPELILHLLSRHVRDLYWTKVSKETMDIPDWRVLKINSQARKFNDNSLEEIVNELAEIDIRIKTSDTDLKSSLDILILKHLE